MEYAISKIVKFSYDEAIEKVTAALKEEGFGILTTIDVKETLKKKIDVDRKPYVILGACNPPFANQSLQAEPMIGLFLPCNVVVYVDDNEQTVVAAFNPEIMGEISPNPEIHKIGASVKERLERVIQGL